MARGLDESWGGQDGAELANPDFMKLADAYGVVGMRAKEPTDVGRLVREAIEKDRPALIEVPSDGWVPIAHSKHYAAYAHC